VVSPEHFRSYHFQGANHCHRERSFVLRPSTMIEEKVAIIGGEVI